MRCPSAKQLSRALIDDHLRAEFSDHLTTCEHCQHELARHRAVAAQVRDLPIYLPSPGDARDAHNALLVAARATAPTRKPRWTWLFAGAGSFAAAAVILVLVVRGAAPAYRAELHPQPDAQFARIGAVPDEIVRLSDGTMTFDVAPLAKGERFRVITGDAEVEARGTAFDVTADRDHLQSVRVLHGRVELRTQGRTIILADGERWEPQIARADLVPAAPPTAPVVDSEPDDSHGAGSQAADPAPVVAASKSSKSSKSSTTRPTQVVSRPPATVTSLVDHAPAKSPVDHAAARPAGDQIAASQVPTPPSAPRRQNELLFEQGWTALAAGKASDAASTFERAALAAPDDPLAEDAWFWRASSLARAKSAQAVGAFDTFLSRYPRSPRTGEASAMLGWLVIGTHPDRAAQLFHVAESDRVPAVRASAQKGLANLAQHH